MVIPLASASTDNAERDNTLQSADFFNVARFAQARYTARGFRSTGGNGYVADGTLELKYKGEVQKAPGQLMPWFDVPGRRTAGITVAFGHWSTLGYLRRPDLPLEPEDTLTGRVR